MKLVILMSGPTACFKTSISKHLAGLLSLELISSHRLFSCSTDDGLPKDDLRFLRYERMIELLRSSIGNGRSCVFDFSFCLGDYLQKTIELAKSLGVQNINIIRLISSDNKKVCERIEKRRQNKLNISNEASNPKTLEIIQKADPFNSSILSIEKDASIMEFDVDNPKNPQIYGTQNGIVSDLVIKKINDIKISFLNMLLLIIIFFYERR